MKKQKIRITGIISISLVLLAAVAGAMFATGCGGGGRAAGMVDSQMPYSPPPWFPPTFEEKVRTTAIFEDVTYYLPGLQTWYLFDGTAKYTWVSAIGTAPGLSASMTNPFKRVGVLLLTKDSYNNPGSVTFYIDGKQVGSLDMSVSPPFEDYNEDFVSYYEIASGLEETTHTVTMVLTDGSIGFDGWRMEYEDQMYDIDCSDANTLEYDTISETTKLRDAIEWFGKEYGEYPNPASFTNLISYIDASSTAYFDTRPTNPFTDNVMTDSEEYSAGDYHYIYSSSSFYTLSAYGGRATLITYTPRSAESDILQVVLDSPLEPFFATTAQTVLFSGTTSSELPLDYSDAQLSISGGLNGTLSKPAQATFSEYITLAEGNSEIKVTMSSPYTQPVSVVRHVIKDTTMPQIQIIEPFPLITDPDDGTEYFIVDESPIVVEIYVEPGSDAYLNGIPMTVDSFGVFSTMYSLSDGDNTLTVLATDSFGNSATESFVVKYDAD